MSYLSQCQCGHIVNDLGIYLLRCLCGSERTTTHDMLQDTIVVITLESEPHVQKKVSHFFLRHTLRRMDIVIIRDFFCTLADVVITDLTHIDLVQCASIMTMHATTIIVQEKHDPTQNECQ